MDAQTYETGLRAKGFDRTLVVGSNPIPLRLTGNARQLVGLTVNGGTDGDKFTFIVNQDVIFDNVELNSLNRSDANPVPFIKVDRELAGQDDISLQVVTAVGSDLYVTVWYRNAKGREDIRRIQM